MKKKKKQGDRRAKQIGRKENERWKREKGKGKRILFTV